MRLNAAYGTIREDTASVCGNTNNGFGLLFNWNRLGDGVHTARALADGREFGRARLLVTTLGEEFLTGVSGAYRLPDFPRQGTNGSGENRSRPVLCVLRLRWRYAQDEREGAGGRPAALKEKGVSLNAARPPDNVRCITRLRRGNGTGCVDFPGGPVLEWLDPCVWDIGALRINSDRSTARMHAQVHIFHGDGPQQHLITEDQRANVAKPVAKTHLDRSHIGNIHTPSIGDGHFSDGFCFQA